jgi:hypothetical protein
METYKTVANEAEGEFSDWKGFNYDVRFLVGWA